MLRNFHRDGCTGLVVDQFGLTRDQTFTYEQLAGMATPVGVPLSELTGTERGSYTDTPLGRYAGLHMHFDLPGEVHVVDGRPDPDRAFRTRKLAVVRPYETEVLIPPHDQTHHQRELMTLLPRPLRPNYYAHT